MKSQRLTVAQFPHGLVDSIDEARIFRIVSFLLRDLQHSVGSSCDAGRVAYNSCSVTMLDRLLRAVGVAQDPVLCERRIRRNLKFLLFFFALGVRAYRKL